VFRPVPGRPVQLGFLLPGLRLPRASSLLLPANRKDKLLLERLGDVVPTRQKWQWLAGRQPVQPVSPHLVDPAQTVLFDARRTWSCLTVGALDQLPALTPAAEALAGEFSQQARSRGWNEASRNNGTKSLRILLAWIGAATPIDEADIRALSDRPGTTIRRVLQFLDERGIVIPDPARQGTAVQRTVQQRIQTLPDGIAGELRQWVQVVRGEGRREHRELPFATIRSYLNCFYPVLAAWTERITSLREITRDDIREALDSRPPVTARNLLPALRSLFRALRQERIIFRDPTSGITLPAMRRLPVPIPTDQLHGLIDRADGPMAKLIVTLIAIHGLGKKRAAAQVHVGAGERGQLGDPQPGLDGDRQQGVIARPVRRARSGAASSASASSDVRKDTTVFSNRAGWPGPAGSRPRSRGGGGRRSGTANGSPIAARCGCGRCCAGRGTGAPGTP
jgi:hypothetical protein